MSFIIYSKPACQHCEQAKSLLQQMGLNYDVVNLDIGQQKDPEAVYITRDELLAKIPTAKTMPQIFKGSTYIGGFQDLKKMLSQ